MFGKSFFGLKNKIIKRCLLQGTCNEGIIKEEAAFEDSRKGDRRRMENLRDIIDRLTSGLQTIFGETLEQIVLYGSFARGTQTEESDVDVAVIARKATEEMYDKMLDLTIELEWECGRVLSVLLIDYDDFKEWENVLPFYVNVKNEGVRLWSAV